MRALKEQLQVHQDEVSLVKSKAEASGSPKRATPKGSRIKLKLPTAAELDQSYQILALDSSQLEQLDAAGSVSNSVTNSHPGSRAQSTANSVQCEQGL